MEKSAPTALEKFAHNAKFLIPLLLILLGCKYQEPATFALLGRIGLGYDFLLGYYAPARALQSGIYDVYSSTAYDEFFKTVDPFVKNAGTVQPPGFFLIVEPFAHLSLFDGYLAFEVCSAAVALLGLLVLARHLVRGTVAYICTAFMAWFLLLWSPIGVDNIALGQLNFFTVGFFCLTFVASERGRPVLAGFFLSLAVLLKMWPLIVVVYFARKKQWDCFKWTFVSLAGLNSIQFFRYGWDFCVAYLSHAKGVGIFIALHSQSLIGVLTYHFGRPILPVAIVLNTLVMLGGLRLLWKNSVRLSSQSSQPQRVANCLEFSGYIGLAIICSAWSWGHHHIVMIVPTLALTALAQCRAHWTGGTASPVAAYIALALVWLLDGEIVQIGSLFALHDIIAQCGLTFVFLATFFVCNLLFLRQLASGAEQSGQLAG